jgi:arabinogalactan endo-1,4-beta-galactosidase
VCVCVWFFVGVDVDVIKDTDVSSLYSLNSEGGDVFDYEDEEEDEEDDEPK